MKKLLIFLTAFVIVSFIFTSCEEEEKEKDYVGTWKCSYTESYFTIEVELEETLILTETTIDQLIKASIADEPFKEIAGMKGTISVDEDSITITVTEIGSADIDYMTLTIGDFAYYEAGSEEFDEWLAKNNNDPTITAKYSVSGDEMTVIITYGDGEEETKVYTKQ